jgi:phosphohistidine phosphatase
MKTLFLMRHAKAGREEAALSDRDRPLTDRGLRDARSMGQRLAQRHIKPGLLVASPAVRTLTTARIVARELAYEPDEIAVAYTLYEAHPNDVLKVIQELDDKLNCVVLFGHNPSFGELAHRFAPEIDHMPPGAVAEFEFQAPSWAAIGVAAPAAATFDYPEKTE